MKLTFEGIEDILFGGSAEQMAVLSEYTADRAVGYRYYPAAGAFEMSVGIMRSKGHGIFKRSNCIGLFGDAHAF